MKPVVYLVSCVKKKESSPKAARQLYCSAWFRKARAYVETTQAPWFILSAKHGLVHPNTVISPYDTTLPAKQEPRRAWAKRTWPQLSAQLQPAVKVIFLAGKKYREFLIPHLQRAGIEFEAPMKHLGIGKQMQWLARSRDLTRFYNILAELKQKLGDYRRLQTCHGRMGWPRRGVYFFFEDGEYRSVQTSRYRVTRVGSHAVSRGSKTKLWDRLRQHKGNESNQSGNHRGSVFRKAIGNAWLKKHNNTNYPTWGHGSTAIKLIRDCEKDMEVRVSNIIGGMRFLWLDIDDEPSSTSQRAYIERNCIALLSNHKNAPKAPIDTPSPNWLGNHATDEAFSTSGLWNKKHIDEPYDPAFLEVLSQYVQQA